MGRINHFDSCNAPTDVNEDVNSSFGFDDDLTEDNEQVEDFLEMERAQDLVDRGWNVYHANDEVDPRRESSFWTENWNEIARVIETEERFIAENSANYEVMERLVEDENSDEEEDSEEEEDDANSDGDSIFDDTELWSFSDIHDVRDINDLIVLLCVLIIAFTCLYLRPPPLLNSLID